MSIPRTAISLFLLAFTVSAPGCFAPGGYTPIFSNTATVSNTVAISPKGKAELTMLALHTTAASSMISRVSIPVQKMAPWVLLVQEIASGSEIDPDQQVTARERKEPRGGQWWKGKQNAPYLEDVAVEKAGFKRMHIRYSFDRSAVRDGLRDGPLGGCEGKAREVDNLDEYPGRPMCVFEPTLVFDDIFVDLTVGIGFQKDKQRRHPGRKPRRPRRPPQCKLRVTIRGASIPVDVFYDGKTSGVKIKPVRRKDEFRIGKCEVEVRKLGPIKLSKWLQRRSRDIIDKHFGDEINTAIQKAVASSALSP